MKEIQDELEKNEELKENLEKLKGSQKKTEQTEDDTKESSTAEETSAAAKEEAKKELKKLHRRRRKSRKKCLIWHNPQKAVWMKRLKVSKRRFGKSLRS